MTDTTTAAPETHAFQAEVGRLLDIVAKSLYSQKEVFLRELISNASDACDKLRYRAIAEPELLADDPDFRVTLETDEAAGTLTVTDNGIGMSRAELVENLGTIAKSGTLAFTQKLADAAAEGTDAKAASSLIGQFGVGFYAAFMVADRVTVDSRLAGTGEAWRWVSDGRTGFEVAPLALDQAPARGTRITLALSDEGRDFLAADRLRHVVKTYSDHIPVPIELIKPAAEVLPPTDDADPEVEPDLAAEAGPERLNRAAAFWTRSKSEITADAYKEFYHHVAHAYDDPWRTIHYRAEGVIEYTALLYVPGMAPFDLYHPERRHGVKLYVRRVFVSDQAEGLLPPYLRFLKGVVDSEDLPLNVSRELLQNEPTVAKIRKGLTKRVLSELAKAAKHDQAGEGPDADIDPEDEGYAGFWDRFGPVLKEGLHEDFENRDTLVDLARFKSTADDGWVSLETYVGRMKEGQEAIYYITGDDADVLARSPQLEGFKAKGVEVLYFTDPVDEFWPNALGGRVKDKPLTSVTRGAADLSGIAKPADGTNGAEDQPEADPPAEGAAIDALVVRFKLALGDAVKDVRPSERLTDSAVCLVADDGELDMHLERLLKRHKQLDALSKRVLEINPKHPLIAKLADRARADGDAGDGQLGEMAYLLLDQARIIEGETVPDAVAFARRLNDAVARALV